MPQRRCCVACCNSTEKNVVLHNFPNPMTNPERCRIWITNAGLIGESEDVYKKRRICAKHFESIYCYPNNRLNRLAIPTLDLPGAALAVLEHIDVDQPLLSQPVLAEFTVSAESGATRTSIPMMLNDPQPSTSMEMEHPQPSTSCKINTFFMDDINSTSMPMMLNDPQPSTSMEMEHPQPSTSCKKNTIFRTMDPEGLDKIERSLYEKFAKTQAQLQKCKESKAGLKNKIKLANKLRTSVAYELVTKHLSPAAKTFFAMQIRQANKKPKGRRFTLDEKILALSLNKPSPKAYRLLSQICVLPKKSTLNKLMENISLSPGRNNAIFEHLKKRVQKMPACHKYCIIIFDEMAISANLSFDKHRDIIKGFCDDGSQRSKSFADHVLVFMVRGIFKKYKQPIFYSFCAGTTKTNSLKSQIKEVIQKTLETGLRVVGTTCDQGSTNMAAINSLLTETRENYLREGKEYRGGFFEINANPIYPIYDPPHLLKGIRNNLINKNLQYELENKIRVAKWDHIVLLYKKRPGYKGVRLLPKLTARHAIPHLIPKMKVKYCTQVFSKTVSVAMGLTARYRRIPRESTDTADLLMFFDNLFDSVNGSSSRSNNGKIYRSAVKPKSPHWRLWSKSLPVLKSMKFLGTNGKGVVPSLTSWIKTIEAFQTICKKLHCLGLQSLLLRNFNQDPLENFFGAIRAHGHSNTMPSSTAFEASYKALIITNMVSPKSVGANCETDDCYCLENLKLLLNSNSIQPLPSRPCPINMEDLKIILPNNEVLLASCNPADLEKCAAAAYCAGWIISMIYKKITKNCEACKTDLEGGSEEEYSAFIHLKKNTEKSVLHYPNKNLLEYIIHLEEITIQILKRRCQSPQISEYIKLMASSLISLNLICAEHKEEVSKFIINKSVVFFIQDWCNEITNILHGKTTVYDENDGIKKLAYDHFVKHKVLHKRRHFSVQ